MLNVYLCLTSKNIMNTVKYTNKCGSSTFRIVANIKIIIKFCKQKTIVLHNKQK